MTHRSTAINRPWRARRAAAIALAMMTALAPLSITASARAMGNPAVKLDSTAVKLDSTMFAAQVGSTSGGGSVFAGALPDRRLGQGAIVFTATGGMTQQVTFQEFFALGSVKGRGTVTITPRSGGSAALNGRLRITQGTGRYRHAKGTLTAHGTINKAGMVTASLKGSFSR